MAVVRRECITCGYVFPTVHRRERGTKNHPSWHEERGHKTKMVDYR